MTVVLETTKGNIELGIHKEWAPLGTDHFLELVKAGFYDGAPWFRVMEGFVAQCGVSADPKMNTLWLEKTIQDEPVKQGNKLGYVAFGKTGAPNSRSTHIFINLADNSAGLDPQGFACFAVVTSGMDVAQKLFRCEYGDQGGLALPGGIDKFKAMFPQADYIKKAYIKQ
jgi:peptidyl-prolyl cis-trans isomerase A (cyclophilin A)